MIASLFSPSQHAISTQMRDLLVRSNEDYIRITAKHNVEWSIFGLGTSAAVLGPLVAYVYVSRMGGSPPLKGKSE